MERRELFSSLTSSFFKEEASESIIRPPYYENESDFHKNCINCDGKCSSFCEEHIIKIAEDKTPYLDFSSSGCSYCDECANSCDEFNVLSIESKKQINVNISIDVIQCLSWNKTMCFSCKDPCLDDAIKFLGMFRPEIKTNKCTSCGFCIKACPTNAIKITGV